MFFTKHDLDAIDEAIMLAESSSNSDSELRKNLDDIGVQSNILTKIKNLFVSLDPLSDEYKENMKNLHQELICTKDRTSYKVELEGLPDLNVQWETDWGFPWGTRDFKVVGDFVQAYGFAIQTMALPPQSKILEPGCGLASLTEMLVRMGYEVDALDVNATQCEICRNKLVRLFPPHHTQRTMLYVWNL